MYGEEDYLIQFPFELHAFYGQFYLLSLVLIWCQLKSCQFASYSTRILFLSELLMDIRLAVSENKSVELTLIISLTTHIF